MRSRKLTVLLIPDNPKRVRGLRVPAWVAVCMVTLAGLGAGFLVWAIQDYLAIKPRMPQLAVLEKENEEQREQFLFLTDRINQLTDKVRALLAFDRKLRVMVNLESGEESSEGEGVGGSDSVLWDPRQPMKAVHREMVRSMHRSLDNLSGEVALGEEGKAELLKFLESQKVLLASTPSIWPTKGWLSSRFGYRVSPFTGEKELHKGIDVSTRLNAPVLAPADGIVAKAFTDRGYGRTLVISHGYGVKTRYAHLQKILVQKGQHVKRGETIALVGNTGRSTGPHLHYEVHLNGVPVNPSRYILN